MNQSEEAALTPLQKAMASQLGELYKGGSAETPDSTGPLANELAKNSQQRGNDKVKDQENALDRVNEIRKMWESSDESQRKGLLQAQRDWEETAMHTGQGPLGEYGSSWDFASKEPIQKPLKWGGGFSGWSGVFKPRLKFITGFNNSRK
jgi:hypothetical protein